MRAFTKNIITSFCFTALLGLSAAVSAQSLPTGIMGYDDKGVPYSDKYWEGQAVYNTISLIRKPELADDQFIIRLSSPDAINGCVDISNYGHSASFTEYYMDISVEGITVDYRDQPQYAHYDCDMSTKVPVADVVISKSTLIENGTKIIRMHNESETNYYTVNLTDNRVVLLPDETDVSVNKKFVLQELPMRKSSSIYWFYPMGTLVVWTPQLTDANKAAAQITAFAEKNGLTPLSNIFEDFESPLHDPRFHYFVDTAGKFDNVAGLENGSKIGHISMKTVKYGLAGDEIATKDVTIFARKPGMYD